MPISCLGQRLQFSFSLFLNKKNPVSLKKEFLLFSVNLPVALSGGAITFQYFSPNSISLPVYLFIKPLCCCFDRRMGIAAFITEISTPEQRTFRLAMIHFVGSLGRPIGTKVWTPFYYLIMMF